MILRHKKNEPPRSDASNSYDLLEDFCTIALENPLRIRMGSVLLTGAQLEQSINAMLSGCPMIGASTAPVQMPDCGTVGCVAGWTLALRGFGVFGAGVIVAGDKLGLDFSQRQELFFPSFYQSGDQQTKTHARLTVAHVRAFMNKYEAQLKDHQLS